MLPSVAPTREVPPHWPSTPAVQSVRDCALCRPFDPVNSASPSVWVTQPVPAQLAMTSATPVVTYPLVTAWQAPAVPHVAVDVAYTPAAPVACDCDDARVAHPVALPSAQVTPTEALVAASGPDTATVEPALICASHAVAPEQPVSPLALLRDCCPPSSATACAVPVKVAVQPASGHATREVVCAAPGEAVASLPTAHPEPAAVQVAVVVDAPAVPVVLPVVAAVQPTPAHCAPADDSLVTAGAPVTGLAASSAASDAVTRACSAPAAASAAAFFCSAVASARPATRAASAA